MSTGSALPVSRKRKWDNEGATTPPLPAGRGRPGSVIVESSTKAIELVPRLLIPREHLPFAYTAADRAKKHGPTFNANIDCLEKNRRNDQEEQTKRALVASTPDGRHFFAVERVKAKSYVVSPLPGWSCLERLDDQATKRIKLTPQEKRGGSFNAAAIAAAPWWDKTSISLPAQVKPTTAMEGKGPMAEKPAVPHKKETPSEAAPTTPKEVEKQQVASEWQEEDTPRLTLEEVATALRQKYLEALYISRTSLAYFAKGPLTRARNTIPSAIDLSTERNLSTLLSEIIMTIPMSDKKYLTALPELINEMPAGAGEFDLHADAFANIRDTIRKSKKRKKLSKYGFLPSEEEFVVQWWLEKENNVDSISPDLSHKEKIRASLARQRTRETQAQVMLVLEGLIAQTGKKEASGAESGDGGGQADSASGRQDKKGRRHVDLHALLDMLVDRLCIWQTTQQDEGDGLFGNRLTVRDSGRVGLQGTKVNALQEFCTEVLVPFYAARTPKIFASLCQKMGTVGVSSPGRPTLRKSASALGSKAKQQQEQQQQHQVKPGSAMSRTGLKRVSTEGSLSRRTPSLARSSTDSSALKIKREETEDLLLQAIPLHKASNLHQDRRYSQREVDIAAITKATRVRQERKAFLEQELANAIDVLKKPNSRAAVRELVDFADERQAGASSNGSKSTSKRKRDPIFRNSSNSNINSGVHVKATPRANRWQGRRNAHDQDHGPGLSWSTHQQFAKTGVEQQGATSGTKQAASGEEDDGEAPPSSDPRVPSTSKRLPSENLLPVVRSTSVVNPIFADAATLVATIEATPMRKRQRTIVINDSSQPAVARQEMDGIMSGLVEATPSRGLDSRRILFDRRQLVNAYYSERSSNKVTSTGRNRNSTNNYDDYDDHDDLNDRNYDDDDDDDNTTTTPFSSVLKLERPLPPEPLLDAGLVTPGADTHGLETPIRRQNHYFALAGLEQASLAAIAATPSKVLVSVAATGQRQPAGAVSGALASTGAAAALSMGATAAGAVQATAEATRGTSAGLISHTDVAGPGRAEPAIAASAIMGVMVATVGHSQSGASVPPPQTDAATSLRRSSYDDLMLPQQQQNQYRTILQERRGVEEEKKERKEDQQQRKEEEEEEEVEEDLYKALGWDDDDDGLI